MSVSSDEETAGRFFDHTMFGDEINAYFDNESSSMDEKHSNDNMDMNDMNDGFDDDMDSLNMHMIDNDNDDMNKRGFNVFNPTDEQSKEMHHLLEKDKQYDMHGRLLRDKVMFNHKYYYSALTSFHIWVIFFVKALNHLMRKLYEYFAWFLYLNGSFQIASFYSMTWTVASLDMACIVSQLLVFPFVISKKPHFVQLVCEALMGLSLLSMVWWNTFAGLFVLRFVFGIVYTLMLCSWSACITTFVSPSKRSSFSGKIEMSWPLSSFLLILCAYVLSLSYGVNWLFYILSILAVISAAVLWNVMPSQRMIHTDLPDLRSVFGAFMRVDWYSVLFLLSFGMVTFANSTLTLLLAPWLSTDYELTLAEFGYCTVMIGTSQMFAIIFSYQFSMKLGVGWAMLAGILIQCLMFFLLLILNNNGVLYEYIFFAQNGDSSKHYTFPLLLTLLILAIHFLAAEFTYINSVSCMMQVSGENDMQNAMRTWTSVCRIIGAVVAPYIWYQNQFRMYCLVAVCMFALAFLILLGLMLRITCNRTNHEEYTKLLNESNDGDDRSMLFDEDLNDEYIDRILPIQHNYSSMTVL